MPSLLSRGATDLGYMAPRAGGVSASKLGTIAPSGAASVLGIAATDPKANIGCKLWLP